MEGGLLESFCHVVGFAIDEAKTSTVVRGEEGTSEVVELGGYEDCSCVKVVVDLGLGTFDMTWSTVLSPGEVKQISRGFHGMQVSTKYATFGEALGMISEKVIVDAESKATFIKQTGTSNFVKNSLHLTHSVVSCHLKDSAKKLLTRKSLQRTMTNLRHPSISLSLDVRHSVHCCGGVIRRRPGHQNGMLLSNGPGLLPGTPDPFHKLQQVASPKDNSSCTDNPASPEYIGAAMGMQWRLGTRKTTKTALAKKRLDDDVLLAKSLQQQFDEEVGETLPETDPRCSLCQTTIPFDGSIASIPSCDICTLYCCVRCFTGHLQAEAVKATNGGKPSSTIPCFNPRCRATVCQADLRRYLTDGQLSTLDTNDLTAAIKTGKNEYVKCPKCLLLIECDPSNQKMELQNMKRRAQNGAVELDGVEMCLVKANHYVKYRMRCLGCSSVFCTSCFKTPYHLGQTCEEASNPLHCRFCDSALAKAPQVASWWRRKKKPHMMLEICGDNECQEKASETCLKQHSCGHACNGILDERTCPPCLHEDCHAEGPSGDEFCSICWTEPLSGAPMIQLACGHLVHHACTIRKLEAGWPTSRITFSFMTCPLCSTDIEHPSPAVQKLLTPLKKLKKDLQKRWMDRLRIEGLLGSARLTQKGERFYQKPMDFAQHVLCYYKCIKCSKPYFGGVQQCNVEEEANRQFKREELICGACVDKTSCAVHGTEYIQFKCRYCCKPAVWFCWGTTHFCDKCHRVLPRPIPQCKGADTCPSGVDHPPNGQEYALGCVACIAIKRGEPPITAP